MTRPCFALTVLAALLGTSLGLARQAHCQTFTDMYRIGTEYGEICPFMDGAPEMEDQVPLVSEQQDLRGMAVVAFLEDVVQEQSAPATAAETYDYRNYYEEAYRKYYDEAYNDQDDVQSFVADPEPETMAEAMEAYRSGHDHVYDVAVYGEQSEDAARDNLPSTDEPETYEADEYCADEYEYDDEYYDSYYGGDYRYYEEYSATDPVSTDDATALAEDDPCSGYENYGSQYEDYYTDSYDYDEAADDLAQTPVAGQEEADDYVDTCKWDRCRYDGYEPSHYAFDNDRAEAADSCEEAWSEEPYADTEQSTADQEYWDDSYYGYDYSLGDESATPLDEVAEPAQQPQDESTGAAPCDYDRYQYDDYYYYYYDDDEYACPETEAVAESSEVVELSREVMQSALQSELATVIRDQANKLLIKAGSLLSDANMQGIWQQLHQAAESEANAIVHRQPNIFVFTFELEGVSKADTAGRGALVWAAQVLDRLGAACQQASDQLERLADAGPADAWTAQQDSATQR